MKEKVSGCDDEGAAPGDAGSTGGVASAAGVSELERFRDAREKIRRKKLISVKNAGRYAEVNPAVALFSQRWPRPTAAAMTLILR